MNENSGPFYKTTTMAEANHESGTPAPIGFHHVHRTLVKGRWAWVIRKTRATKFCRESGRCREVIILAGKKLPEPDWMP